MNGIITITATIQGTNPTITHNNPLANPLDPLTKQFKKLTSNKKKTEQDLEDIARIEWQAGLYRHPTTGTICWPGANIHAMLKEAAKRQRMGPLAKQALTCDDYWPIQTPGIDHTKPIHTTNDLDQIFYAQNPNGERKYVFSTLAKTKTSTILRTRPWFNPWTLTFDLQIDTTQLEPDKVQTWLTEAGRYIGLSDWRPKYGKFTLTNYQPK